MSQIVAAGKKASAFSYVEYAQIIQSFMPIIRDFDVMDDESTDVAFCVIRHDIEFSLPKAVRLAELDAQLGIPSTFFVQVKNGAYNPLAPRNARLIRSLHKSSDQVGLHFYISDIGENDVGEIVRQLEFQTMVLEDSLGSRVTRFSYHRPPLWVLKLNLGNETKLLNAYDPRVFEITGGQNDPKNIKYMADSRHAWMYGHPLAFRDKYKQFQILMHPDEWSDNGSTPLDNFMELIELNGNEFLRVLQTECNHFKLHFPASVKLPAYSRQCRCRHGHGTRCGQCDAVRIVSRQHRRVSRDD
jgi:hypothetical protein